MLVSSFATILCIFYFLEKKILTSSVDVVNSDKFGENPIFIVFLLLSVHYLVTKNDMLRPIMLFIFGVLSMSYLAMSYVPDQGLSILTQLASTLDYVKNFDYFVMNFKFGYLEGSILKVNSLGIFQDFCGLKTRIIRFCVDS